MSIEYELNLWKTHNYISGTDEAGRGPLAGPIVIASVILNKEHFSTTKNWQQESKPDIPTNNDISYAEVLKTYSMIDDSKKLSVKKREVLAEFIKSFAICYSIIEISSEEIDELGITQANSIGFYKSIKSLETRPDFMLTDHFPIPNINMKKQTNITRGDSISLSIAAASILAKTHRDNLMTKLHEKHPEYGFDRHKGYGTKLHFEMIEKYGPCKVHRHSFYPITKYSSVAANH